MPDALVRHIRLSNDFNTWRNLATVGPTQEQQKKLKTTTTLINMNRINQNCSLSYSN